MIFSFPAAELWFWGWTRRKRRGIGLYSKERKGSYTVKSRRNILWRWLGVGGDGSRLGSLRISRPCAGLPLLGALPFSHGEVSLWPRLLPPQLRPNFSSSRKRKGAGHLRPMRRISGSSAEDRIQFSSFETIPFFSYAESVPFMNSF